MTKPVREFNANEGDYSIGISGPDSIENDIDTIHRMFDPLTTHVDGSPGGISAENMQQGTITDIVIGERIVNDSIADAYSNTGYLTKLLSFLAKAIKGIKGTATWRDAPSDTIQGLHNRVNANKSSIDTHKLSGDHNLVYYTKTQLDTGQLDTRYHTKAEMIQHLNGGETVVKEETFTIADSNLGDGTFAYTNDSNNVVIGQLLVNGEQMFELEKGSYEPNNNRVEVIINDTLRRSVASGGLMETSPTSFALTSPEGNGAEITVKYYERIALAGEHNLRVSEIKPISGSENIVWFQIIG